MKRYIFDLDGTLLNANWTEEKEFFEKRIPYCKDFSINLIDILNEYEQKHQKYTKLLLNKHIREKEYYIDDYFIDDWIYFVGNKISDNVIDGVKEKLDELKTNNIKISLLTNWFYDCQYERLKRANLVDYFDTIVTGDMALKPYKKSYDLARNNEKKEDTIMIGDNYIKDYLEPINYGINAYYIGKNKPKVYGRKINNEKYRNN